MKLFTLILSATFLAISTTASIQQPLQTVQPVAPVDPSLKAGIDEVIKDVLKDVAEINVDIQAGEKVNPADLLDTVRDAEADIDKIVTESRTVTTDAPTDVIDTIEDALEDAVDNMDDTMDTVQDTQEDAADNMDDAMDTVQDALEDAVDNMNDTNFAIKDTDDIIDQIDIANLTDEEVRSLLYADQEQLVGFLDVYLDANKLLKKNSSPVRRKRWIPVFAAAGRLAFAGGRALFRRFAAKGITRSGNRITRHYSRPGNYFSGLREFKNLNPTKVKKIGGSKFKGLTGKSGPYRVTVRSGSKGKPGSNGPPTLSISSKGGKLVRKFRFERK